MDKFFIDKENSALLIVDVQERLAAVMDERAGVVTNCVRLVELSKMLDINVVLTEQYPRGLGPTVPEIIKALPSYQPIEKLTFDCCGEPGFVKALRELNKKNIILAGMETHICVLQTCISLLRAGFNVHLVRDAVCSRTILNRDTGIGFMKDAGAVITCTETVMFQLLKIAGTEEFKTISRMIR